MTIMVMAASPSPSGPSAPGSWTRASLGPPRRERMVNEGGGIRRRVRREVDARWKRNSTKMKVALPGKKRIFLGSMSASNQSRSSSNRERNATQIEFQVAPVSAEAGIRIVLSGNPQGSGIQSWISARDGIYQVGMRIICATATAVPRFETSFVSIPSEVDRPFPFCRRKTVNR